MDPIILSLLHRYREDEHPSGNPVPALPNHGSTTPGSRQSLSRSSSLRRGGGKPTGMGLGALPPPGLSPSSAPTSPFLPRPPTSASNSNTPSHQSPWSSPRATHPSLSASAVEFKFSAIATDFRPSPSFSSAVGGTSSPLAPSTPIRSHSPNPLAQQAQAQWAATSSPLGTPKFQHGARTPSAASAASAVSSAVNSPSYFPRHLGENVAQQLRVNQAVKPARLPWADEGSDDEEEEEEDDPEPKEELEERGGMGYIDTAAALSPWATGASPAGTPGGGGTMIDPGLAYAQQQYGFPPPPQNEQEWAAQQQQLAAFHHQQQQQYHHQQGYGAYSGGAMWDPAHGYGDDLAPNLGGYPESHTPTSTYEGASMTLPGPAPGEMPSIEFANELSGPSGLGGMGAYQMSPFDLLLSIFPKGSGVEEGVLERALEECGYDVDRAIERIIETQPLPSSSSNGADDSIPPTGQAGFPPLGVVPPPPNLRPLPLSSGSRPLVVSRDSFDGYGPRGAPPPGSGQQRYHSNSNSRPGTPDSSRGAGGVGGRVCRYYLSGNCLRSDCKFSHDVGKAVCK